METPDDFLVEFTRKGQLPQKGCGNGRDLSLQGMRFATPVSLKKGEPLEVFIYFPRRFPDVAKIKLSAEVVRVYKPKGASRYRVGCRLVHLDISTRDMIRNFMEWLHRSQNQ